MAFHDIIVIGASAGGVSVLSQMARNLPAGFPASVWPPPDWPPSWYAWCNNPPRKPGADARQPESGRPLRGTGAAGRAV